MLKSDDERHGQLTISCQIDGTGSTMLAAAVPKPSGGNIYIRRWNGANHHLIVGFDIHTEDGDSWVENAARHGKSVEAKPQKSLTTTRDVVEG